MTLIARKQSSAKQERLRRFVAEHADALEPGLRIIEAGLRLGRMAVDLVAADTRQTLVLIGVAGVATDKMLVGMLDAYIWCLQFPDGLRRLCPDAPITFTRPPRLVVVAEEVPESFMELVSCLSLEVECHELASETSRETAAGAETRLDVLVADAPSSGPRSAAPAGAPMPAAPATPVPVTAAPVCDAAAAATAAAQPGADAPASLPSTPGAPVGREDDEAVEERPAEILAAAPPAEPENPPAVEPEPPMPEPSAAEAAAVPATAAGTNGAGPAHGSTTPPSPFSRNGRRVAGAGVAAGLRSIPVNGSRPPAGRDANGTRPAGRGYVFAQAARQPQPGPAQAVEEPAAESRAGESPAAARDAATPDAAPAPETAPPTPQPRRQSPDTVPFASSGVSRQWQEFLARLASAQ